MCVLCAHRVCVGLGQGRIITEYMTKGVPASSLLSKPRRQLECPFLGGNQGKFPKTSYKPGESTAFLYNDFEF